MYAALAVLFALAQPAGAQLAAEPLVGIVVDSDGKGLADMEVLLSSGLPPSGERPLIGGVLWQANGPRPLGELQAVLTRSRTDRSGHFRIELPGVIVRSQEPLPVALWAFQPDGRVAARRLPWAVPAPAEQVQLVIERFAASVFRVLGENAAPEAGARVQVIAIDGMVVPADLAEKLTKLTGRDGSVTIQAFAPGAIRRLSVQSSKYGNQLIGTPAETTTTAAELRLEPAGRVSARILDETGKPVVGLKVHAQTFPDGYDLGGTVGLAEGVTDSSGRLEISAIAAGRLMLVLDLRSRPDLPYRGLPPANQIVEACQATTVEIRLKRAVRIEGVIRERTTGLPIAGVSPELPDLAVRLGQNAKVVTDALGKFEGYIEGQQPYAFLYTTPKPFFVPSDTPESLHLLPAGSTEFKLPPTELVRGEALRGSVVDETGTVVAGALVRASWGGKEQVLQSVAVRTDSSGNFLLEGLDPLADLRLTAESTGRFSGATLTARAGPEKKVKLVVSQANTVMLTGRVVDSSGKPVEGL
jgi:Carboxypeptidase regulatory-like domain